MNKSEELAGQGKNRAAWNDSWHKGTFDNNAPLPCILAVEPLYIIRRLDFSCLFGVEGGWRCGGGGGAGRGGGVICGLCLFLPSR